nr:hypothetical protein [Tanacetum cinerariifolium]
MGDLVRNTLEVIHEGDWVVVGWLVGGDVVVKVASKVGRIVRIKRHLNAVGITDAHIDVNTVLMKALRLQEHSLRRAKDLSPKGHPLRPRDITFTTPDEGTAKTTPRLEGSHGDKDLGGNKPPVDMKPQNPTNADLSRIGAKY